RFIERAEPHFRFGGELLQSRCFRRRCAVVGDCEALVARVQIARTRQPGATESDDDAACALGHAQRTFRVASPISTRITEMIQNRTITFGSAQPLSSK